MTTLFRPVRRLPMVRRNLAASAAVERAMHDVPARPARILRIGHLAFVLGVVLTLAACSAGAVPPTGGPSASPSPTEEPAATDRPTSGAGEVDHPTGSDDVVLRMTQGGGFVPFGFMATEMPNFTLYGDGTVIYRPSISAPPVGAADGTYPPLQAATLTPAQMDQLLTFALGPGGLENARARYDHPLVADAPTTLFEIDAGGVKKTVSVYALGLDLEDPAGNDNADRTAFLRLAEVLNGFDREIERGNATAAGDHEPEVWRAILIEGEGSEGERRDWPFSELQPSDFTENPDVPFRSAVLTPGQARELLEDPEGGTTGVLVTGPDGAPYTLALRPLLPDEDR